jgi:hypothetical protein
MVNAQTLEDDEFAVDCSYAPPEEGHNGPPDGWTKPSWFNRETGEWWWCGSPNPCPAEPLGHIDGQYVFRTAAGEVRRFTAGALHANAGPSDLFGGEMEWPLRHFRKWDPLKGRNVGGLQKSSCMAAMIRACILAGYYDNAVPYRSVGTWRGPEGRPVIHAGDRIFVDRKIYAPGVRLGDALFVIGSARQAPAHVFDQHGYVEWQPAPASVGCTVAAHLDEYAWESLEDRDLFLGSLHCNMLCAALTWLPHVFIQAPQGSGKSTLLKYAKAIVGGAAHPVVKDVTKAFVEQHFTSTAMALFLDEMESDTDPMRVSRLFELFRLMSDDGAEGGRGSAGGKSRKLDVHGTVTMAATVSGEWRPQDRSRIMLLSLRPFASRGNDHTAASPATIAAHLKAAAEMSPGLRARALATWDLFHQNLKAARGIILKMGGQPRDADQLGHLVAGWATTTSDQPLDPERHEELARFRPFIMSLAEAEDGEDEANNCLNTIFGLALDKWVGGERVTVGQCIAHARRDDGASWRRTLTTYGLMLERNEGEAWSAAWLAVANRHPSLDELLTKYPQYQGKKRRQILSELRRKVDDVVWEAKKSEDKARIGGSQTRYLLIPPVFLPSESDEAT